MLAGEGDALTHHEDVKVVGASQGGPTTLRQAAPAAFERFFKEHYGRLVFLLVSTLRADRDDAEEAVQSAMFEVLRRWDTVNDPAAYTYRAAAYQLFRARARRPVLIDLAQVPDIAAPSADSPEVVVVGREAQEQVAAALELLPLQQRRIMSSVLEGSTPDEVAERVGLSSSTVRTHLQRARRALQQAVGQLTPDVAAGVPRQRDRREAEPITEAPSLGREPLIPRQRDGRHDCDCSVVMTAPPALGAIAKSAAPAKLSARAAVLEPFVSELRSVRRAVGNPTYKDLVARARPALSAPGISRMLTGHSVPSWSTTRSFLHACDVEAQAIDTYWRPRWMAVKQQVDMLDWNVQRDRTARAVTARALRAAPT